MHAMQLRQSLKGVKLAYALVIILAVAIAGYWYTVANPPDVPVWVPLLAPGVLLLLTFIATSSAGHETGCGGRADPI
jgi:hypothetical protein